MGNGFKEVAMFRTDKKKYDENYDRIFGKKKKVFEVEDFRLKAIELYMAQPILESMTVVDHVLNKLYHDVTHKQWAFRHTEDIKEFLNNKLKEENGNN